jgi:hypothetical protein
VEGIAVLVRAIESFCAAPYVDVGRGWVIDCEPWLAKAWISNGHAVALEDQPAVPSGYLVSYSGDSMRVVSKGDEAAAEPAPVEDANAASEPAAEGDEAGAAEESADATQHPEAVPDAVVTQPAQVRNREPRRARGN